MVETNFLGHENLYINYWKVKWQYCFRESRCKDPRSYIGEIFRNHLYNQDTLKALSGEFGRNIWMSKKTFLTAHHFSFEEELEVFYTYFQTCGEFKLVSKSKVGVPKLKKCEGVAQGFETRIIKKKNKRCKRYLKIGWR